MKKTIIIFLMLIASLSYSQNTSKLLIAAASATVTANTTYTVGNANIGSIHITTSSTFAGTTGTVALQGSNDLTNWATVYADDNTTALSFTLTAASTSYVWLFKAVMYQSYRLVYTAGNASAGTISATITTR